MVQANPVSREMSILLTSIALLSNPAKKNKSVANIMSMMVTRNICPIDQQFDAPRNATTAHLIAQHGTPAQLE